MQHRCRKPQGNDTTRAQKKTSPQQRQRQVRPGVGVCGRDSSRPRPHKRRSPPQPPTETTRRLQTILDTGPALGGCDASAIILFLVIPPRIPHSMRRASIISSKKRIRPLSSLHVQRSLLMTKISHVQTVRAKTYYRCLKYRVAKKVPLKL